MKKYAILGYPLGHTLSPQIHKKLFSLANIEAEYEILEIPPEKLTESYPLFRQLTGFNITIPYKIPIIDFCDELDEKAKRYMTINCIKTGEKTTGYNTDVVGFTKSIETMGASLNSRVLLLGCGGVGRMMAVETAFQGGSLTIACRDEDTPVAIKIKSDIKELLPKAEVFVTALNNIQGEFDLLVNSTPVGMYPKTDAMPVDKKVLENIKYLFDAVYNPCKTKLMAEAEKQGVIVSGGMAMLVWQAVVAHEIWDNSKYELSDINSLISEMEKLV